MVNNIISHSCSLTEFETTEQEIRNFINHFFEHGIKNENLSRKLYQIFNSKSFSLDTLPNGENTRILHENDNDISIEPLQRAKIGDRISPQTFATDLKTVRGIIHEAGHSGSQKFDKEWLNSPKVKEQIKKSKYFEKEIKLDGKTSKQKIVDGNSIEKDTSTGEIEAKFIEMIFDDFVLHHSDSFEQSGNSIANIESLKEEIQVLEQYDILDMLERLTKGMKEDNPDYRQSNEHRYIIGSVVANLLFEEYKKDPEGTLELFYEYLENQCYMDINQTVEFLTIGKAKDFGAAVEQYKQILQVKTTSQTQKINY